MSQDSKEPGTAIVSWREKMQVIATQAAESEAPKGGFLSFKGGRMSYNDEQIPDNKLNVIIVDFVLENAWYPDRYNPNKTVTPSCYAFGRHEELLKPHEEAPDKQGDEDGMCSGCPKNEWGSDPDGGRGKACKNSRRIAVISADTLQGGVDAIRRVSPVLCKLPVTSLKNFSSHINKIVKVMGAAPLAVVCELSVQPHPSNQFEVVWKILDLIADEEILSALAAKYDAIQKTLWAPYPQMDDEPPARQSNKY